MNPNLNLIELYNTYTISIFVGNQVDIYFEFLNIDINDKIVNGTFKANNNNAGANYVDYETL